MMLDIRPARTDLTDRECFRIISGLLGSLYGLSEPEALRKAVRWIAEAESVWEMLEIQQKSLEDAGYFAKR